MVRLTSAAAAFAVLCSLQATATVPAAKVRGLSEAGSVRRRRLQKDNNNMNNDNGNGGNNNANNNGNNAAPNSATITLSQIYDQSLVNNGNGGNGGDQGGGNQGGNQGGGNPGGGTDNTLGPPGTSPNAVCGAPAEYVDVVIIGAGMSGIQAAATLRAQDPTLTYVLLESTDRVGGRVRSVDFGGVKIEDGANWILDFQDNPMMEMAQAAGNFKFPVHNWADFKTYDENVRTRLVWFIGWLGERSQTLTHFSYCSLSFLLSKGVLIDQEFVVQEEQRFLDAWGAAEVEADNQWDSNHESYPDNGVRALLAQEGWEIQTNLDYTIEWSILDYEYAAKDTSVRFFPYYTFPAHHVNDPRGYESLVQTHFRNNVDSTKLRSDSRVKQVNYDESVSANGKTYKAVVSTTNSAGGCKDYYGQRVISTVSTGVINNDLITFNPPLAFPARDFNPYYMTQYVKIFYQFDNQFWDTNQLLRTVRDEQNRGHCHHWSNLNAPGFIEGSNIIRCEIMTEAFDELVDPVTKDLTNATLLSLLDPLRATYGAANVPTPTNMYYPKLNKDVDFGYGAYANWKTGATFTQFAHMYGGVEDVVPYCDHNGCNSNGEWTMMISGSATCYNHAEYVHGAYFSGEKAANNVLRELGYDVPNQMSPCDEDSWQWLK